MGMCLIGAVGPTGLGDWLLVILQVVWRATRREGTVNSLFLVLYGAMRFVVEFTREPDPHLGFVAGPFTMGSPEDEEGAFKDERPQHTLDLRRFFIARCLLTGGSMGTPLYDPADPFCGGREPDDRSFTIDHFYTKLFRLPATMQTAAGRDEARRRVEYMQGFLGELAKEISNSRFRE